MLAKMSDTNILYIDDIVGNQPDLCMEVSSILCVIIETLSIQVRIQNPMVSYFINFNAGNEFQCLKC